MANKLVFTDESLSTLVSEIKAYTDDSSSTRATAGHGIYYGTCSTAAGTAAKVVTLTDSTGFSLTTGAVVVVKFTNANSIASPTLNVNSTGAKSIYRYGTTAASTSASSSGWRAGAVQIFVYDGTGWVRDFWENTTYANYSLGQGYGTCATAAATAAKVVTLSNYSLSAGGIVAVKFTYAVPASATMNINSKGAKNIYYRGAAITADVIQAGDVATFIYDGTQYHLLSVDRWQSDIENLESSLENKQATITGGATTITSSNLTTNRALISNGSGKVAVSAVTSTELGYLDGVTSNVQAQLDNKANASHTHTYTTTIATSTGTNELTLAHGGKYSITAGGDSFVFTMPSDNNTDTNVRQYASSSLEADENGDYPLLMAYSDSPTSGTSSVTYYDTAITVNPSTNTLKVSGSDDTATLAEDGLTVSVPSTGLTTEYRAGYITNGSKSIMLPSSAGTLALTSQLTDNNKVTNTLATTTKAYVTGTTSASTNTGTQVFDTGVYLDTTAGQLTATAIKTDTIKNSNGVTLAFPSTSGTIATTDYVDNGGITIDSSLSTTSTNPVQNAIVTAALNQKAAISHAAGTTAYGASSASNYGHAKASSTTPKANGTAAVGSETSSFARGDHVHPLQTSHFGITTAGTGAAYTATVPEITALTVGATFVMIPHTVSTSTTPTLDVNGLGAKGIRRRLSNISTTVQSGYSANWLGANQPFTVVYNGTYWIVEGNIKTAAVDLYGTLSIAKGGTGATTAEAALTNLGLTATAAELNVLDGITATTTELNYMDGVTSNVQTQLNNKLTANGWSTSSGQISWGSDAYLRINQSGISYSQDNSDGTGTGSLSFPDKTGTIAVIESGGKLNIEGSDAYHYVKIDPYGISFSDDTSSGSGTIYWYQLKALVDGTC